MRRRNSWSEIKNGEIIIHHRNGRVEGRQPPSFFSQILGTTAPTRVVLNGNTATTYTPGKQTTQQQFSSLGSQLLGTTEATRTVLTGTTAVTYVPGGPVIEQELPGLLPQLLSDGQNASLSVPGNTTTTTTRVAKLRSPDEMDRLSDELNSYIYYRRANQSRFSTFSSWFWPGRSILGGYDRCSKLNAAEYLRQLISDFKKPTSRAEAVGAHLGPLQEGKLGALFAHYRKHSGDHYERYQQRANIATKALSVAPTQGPSA